MKKRSRSFQIQEPYRTGYKIASKGKWYYEEYWIISHLEKRKANPQKMRHPLKEKSNDRS
tara:strand:+ start:1045 stop:1224 length:180 start_codon:yes stop_codon:yes gene_type:complete